MIIACPECRGKLSTSAPSCPHCGYIQKGVAAPESPGSKTAPATEGLPPEFVPPSRQALREATRRQFMQWNYDSFWPMAFGMAILLTLLGIAALVVFFIRVR